MNTDIASSVRPALVMTLLFALLTGILYPLATAGLGQLLFPRAASGSLIIENGSIVGSELIGQGFASARYFHPRPSAAGKGYDPLASAGSNLGPASKMLADRVTGDLKAAHAVARGAKARGLAPGVVRGLVEQAIRMPTFGFLGEPRVNVLLLNRQMDRLGSNVAR